MTETETKLEIEMIAVADGILLAVFILIFLPLILRAIFYVLSAAFWLVISIAVISAIVYLTNHWEVILESFIPKDGIQLFGLIVILVVIISPIIKLMIISKKGGGK